MLEKKHITGIILAGGKSSRMGTDKALFVLNGSTFLDHIIRALEPLVDEILIVSNDERHSKYNLKRVRDTIADAGPISGLHAGLTNSATENNLVMSCDIPLIETSMLEVLLQNNEDDIDVIQLADANRVHPLIALYKKCSAEHLGKALFDGERKLSTALNGLNMKSVLVSDGQAAALTNINTQMDFEKIENGNTN
tara:strand:- start:597 stop:1181 length:585 start_codon:yes stop_codon:yes gene_type:complete